MTVYPSAARLAAAQVALDTHTHLSADGTCPACQVAGPCPAYRNAILIFRRAGQLPVRTPGLSRPELINARRIDPAGCRSWPPGR